MKLLANVQHSKMIFYYSFCKKVDKTINKRKYKVINSCHIKTCYCKSSQLMYVDIF